MSNYSENLANSNKHIEEIPMKRRHKSSKSLNLLAIGSSLLLLSTPILPLVVFSSQGFAQETVNQALTEEKLEQIARSITVKIIAGNNGGSGVIIKKEGQTYTILTNEHIITANKKYTVETADGKVHEAKLVPLYFQGKDLALLQFISNVNYSVASLANLSTLEKGDKVFVAGFPFQDNPSSSRQFVFRGGEHGRVSFKLSKPLQGGYLLGYTNDVEKGMSGGPILNSQGDVIGINGIHAHPLWGDPYVYEDGKTPNEELISEMRRSSWGIPIEVVAQIAANYVPTIAQSQPSAVPSTLPSMPKQAMEVNQIAKEISVLITWPNENGTGIIVAQEGNTYYVVTAKHIPFDEELKIITHDGQEYPIKIVKHFDGNDLSLLQFTSEKSYRVATIGDYPRTEKNQLVFVSGWPASRKTTAQTINSERQFRPGYLLVSHAGYNLVTDYSSLNVGYGLVYTNITEVGMSGGPVLDTEGRLIGIHTIAEGCEGDQCPILENTQKDQRLDFGYSIGIPIHTFLTKLDQENILLPLTSKTSPPKQLGEAEEDQIVNALVNLQQPDSNANEVDWLNYGNKLWRLRRYTQAQQALKKAIQIKPDFFEAWYGQGLALVGDKQDISDEDWKEAITAFTKAKTINPKSDLAWRQIGDAYWYLGEFEQALQALQKAIDLNSNDFILYNWIADAYRDLGRYPEALKAGDKAISLKPDHAESYWRRAQTRSLLNDYSGAIADVDEAIKLDPNSSVAYRFRGIFRRQAFQSRSQSQSFEQSQSQSFEQEKVLADYNKALELDRHDPLNHAARGYFYATIGQREQFQKDFEQAIRLDPDNAEIYRARADAYSSLGETEKAIADSTEAIRLAPEKAYVFYNQRGDIRQRNKDFQGAIKDYNEAINFRSNYRLAYIGRGFAYVKLGDRDKAFQDLDKAVSLAPKDSWIYTSRGNAYFILGEYNQGIQEYQKGIGLAPPELAHVFYINRGDKLVEFKNYEVAIKDYTEAIRLQPQNGSYYSKRGDTYAYQLKDYQKAIADYTEAINLEQNNAVYYSYRGYFYRSLEDYQKALEDVNRAITLNPKYAIAYRHRAFIYSGQGKYPEAISDYNEAIKLEPNEAFNWGFRGLCYRALQEHQKAVEDFTQAIIRNPQYAGFYEARALVYSRQEKYTEAIADYTMAAQLYQEQGQSEEYQNVQNTINVLKGIQTSNP